MKPSKIIAISLAGRDALLDDDRRVPITNLFDEFGEETDSNELAVKFVAGPTATGKWLVDWVENFSQSGVH